MVSCTGSTCSTTSSSHGTHTAGIIGGDGTGNVLDANGFLRGIGVAPGVSMIEQRYAGTFTQPGGMLLLMTQSQRNGAVVTANSWGPAGSPRGYDSDTRQVDVGVRDADPDAAGNQPLLYVLSIMNGNGGTSTQGTPDEAKNTLTVGSTRAQISSLAPSADLASISANSGHGPALDGRIIPHLVAPGCSVDSTTPNNTYGLNCGTSMASPQVSGAAALYIERFKRWNANRVPSPALVKAVMTASAIDLVGNRDANNNVLAERNTPRQGWGRMDLARVFNAPRGSVIEIDQTTVLSDVGNTYRINPQVLDPTKPVNVMLTWTDAPAAPLGGSAPAWVNDLDLNVRTARRDFWGNSLDITGFSRRTGTPDTRNNLEGLAFAAGELTGTFEITVSATNLPGDGIPNNADLTDQDFALVCFNCVIPGETDLVFKDPFRPLN
jgi:serine protease AprX